jgi:hypothetical protein
LAAAFTPKSTQHHPYGQHTPATPMSREGLAKRACITIRATPPSAWIQQLPSLDVNMQNQSDDDDEMPELLPRRLFPSTTVSTSVHNASSNDVFGPTPLPLPPSQPQPFPMPNLDNHILAQMGRSIWKPAFS